VDAANCRHQLRFHAVSARSVLFSASSGFLVQTTDFVTLGQTKSLLAGNASLTSAKSLRNRPSLHSPQNSLETSSSRLSTLVGAFERTGDKVHFAVAARNLLVHLGHTAHAANRAGLALQQQHITVLGQTLQLLTHTNHDRSSVSERLLHASNRHQSRTGLAPAIRQSAGTSASSGLRSATEATNHAKHTGANRRGVSSLGALDDGLDPINLSLIAAQTVMGPVTTARVLAGVETIRELVVTIGQELAQRLNSIRLCRV